MKFLHVFWVCKRAGHKMNVVFPCCANWETFVADTKSFWTKSQTLFVFQTQNLCPQQMLRARANGEKFVSATMCPRLAGPLNLFTLLPVFYLNLWCGVACWQCRFLFLNLLGLASRCSSLPTFSGTFLHHVNCFIDLYFYMHICRAWLARAAVSCFYLLFHLFLQVVIRPVRQHVSSILNHWHLGGLTYKGSCSPLTSFSIFALFQFVLIYPCCFYDLLRGKRALLAWTAGPFSFFL